MKEERKMEREDANLVKKIWKKKTVKIGTILILAAGIGLGNFFYQTNYAVASTIWLNGNSGIEIKVNQNEKVLEVNAKDTAAQEIIGKTDFRGSNLDVTIHAILGSMIRNGYLDEKTDSVMVRVECKDSDKEQKLQKELTEEVDGLLQTDVFLGSKLNVTELETSSLVEGSSAEYAETTGKDTYIGEEKAKEIVFSHAAVSEGAVLQYHTKLDYEDGIMTYEIEFYVDGYEYDYDINAITGEIISQKKEQHHSYMTAQADLNGNTQSTENISNTTVAKDRNMDSYISEAEAKTMAFSHAGVSAETVFLEKCQLDYENGIMVYEIEFQSDGYEYDYDVNATTGEIISQKKEIDNHYVAHENQNHAAGNQSNGASASNTEADIGEEQAKTTAFSHAGVSADQVWLEKCKRDYEDGIMVYEIEFQSGDYEYDYDINAVTGEVISFKKEVDTQRSGVGSSGTGTTTSYISEAEAREIALSHAGLSGVSGLIVEVELDSEDGIMVYEIEIKSGGYEHKCEINAVTGVVVSYEKEWDD